MSGLSVEGLQALVGLSQQIRLVKRAVAVSDEERAFARLTYPAVGWRTWRVGTEDGEPRLCGPWLDALWVPGESREDVYACGTEEYARRYFFKDILSTADGPALYLIGKVLLWGERRALRPGDSSRELRFSRGYPLQLCGGLDRREPRGVPPVAEVREHLRELYGLPDCAHALRRVHDGRDEVRPTGHTADVDLDRIAAVVEETNPRLWLSPIHGWRHANRVAAAGLELAQSVGADPLVVLLFGLLHDSLRTNDGHDPQHGERAAVLARQLNGTAFTIGTDRLDVLEGALIRHDRGEVTSDATIGACWDADRLQLGRVGIRPSPRLLSTAAAREYAVGGAIVRQPAIGVALQEFIVVADDDHEGFDPWPELLEAAGRSR